MGFFCRGSIKIQNRAARIVTRSKFDENAEPLIKELGWKTVKELVRYDTAITMHKSMHKIAPMESWTITLCRQCRNRVAVQSGKGRRQAQLKSVQIED